MAESTYKRLQSEFNEDGDEYTVVNRDGKEGDLYTWKVTTSNPDLINQLQQEIQQLQSSLDGLKDAKRVAREAYEIQAAGCGIFSDPYAYSILNRETVTSYPCLLYTFSEPTRPY